ncbi:hypothetical protein A0126_18875 (plasmid) [Exiguobacterium sp. N4-1P]|uniref:hypothetical protein n=1 Tax=Exiguobacterium sp. N4-1P TaxID=2051906 RepID=UPI000B597039|nr:hypothetical protein [Exiguobacterium sp. N4-1P]ASI36880.1 hypothetical protein A0126_15195 [Exiguobacterium sp. N4-1P]ASI37653.1 hypothetical protein A0126_18875 [Exiguobacterium sp. N4-1P]
MDTQDMNRLLDATKKDIEEHQKQLFERIGESRSEAEPIEQSIDVERYVFRTKKASGSRGTDATGIANL